MKLYGLHQYDLCLSKKVTASEDLDDEIYLHLHEESLLFASFLNYYLQKYLFELPLVIRNIKIDFHCEKQWMLESFIKIVNLNESVMQHHELQMIILMFIN
jgi:positive regulator of sigma E activity